MERPTDDHEKTNGMTLYAEDTTFGGQVSRKQVARLCVTSLEKPDASAFKVVEVVAQKDVPERALDRQLTALPTVVRGRGGDARAYTPDALARLLSVFAFGGSAPETVNGRVAMVASLAVLWVEAHGGGTLAEQVGAHGPAAAALVAAVALSSLPPLLRGVSASDASLAPFSAPVETLHARIAMLAVAGIATVEALRPEVAWPF